MKSHIAFTVIILLIATGSNAATPSELFEQGNRYFEKKQFDSAVACYNGVLQQGLESAPLYFNLGNAYFRDGDLGHAIMCYLRARRLDPTDDDITSNLEFARRFTSIQMEGVRLNPISSFLESLVAPYRLNHLAWLASACFILFVLTLTFRFGLNIRGSVMRISIALTLILLVAGSFLATTKYNFEYLTQRGVIIAEDCVAYTGPTKNSDRELNASPGLVVEILSESGNFYNVLFENKRCGWVEKDLIAVI